MDTSYHERNRTQTERLKTLRDLRDEEFCRPVGEHWTVAVTVAHIQYWDGRAVGALEAWRHHGIPLTLWTNEERVVNDVRLPIWRELAPREALEQAIKTARLPRCSTASSPTLLQRRPNRSPPSVTERGIVLCTGSSTSTMLTAPWAAE